MMAMTKDEARIPHHGRERLGSLLQTSIEIGNKYLPSSQFVYGEKITLGTRDPAIEAVGGLPVGAWLPGSVRDASPVPAAARRANARGRLALSHSAAEGSRGRACGRTRAR
jgi:hypothetical protein